MRKVLFVIAILSLAFGVAGAKELQKYSCGELITFQGSGERVGGDDMSTATVIPALPYSDIGNTSTFTHLYDVACPYTGSTSPEVVYSFEALTDWTVDVTLCVGSTYDTKLYISDSLGNVVACNDDECPGYVSELLGVSLTAGDTYFFFVDGYGGGSGDYTFDIDGTPGVTPPEPGETCETAVEAFEMLNSCPGAPFWYFYTTSNEPGDLFIESCIDGQTIDTVVYLVDNCVDLTQLGYNDDGACEFYNYASQLIYPGAAPSTTYLIFFSDNYSSSPFDFNIFEVVNGVANEDTSFGAVKAMFR